MVTTGISRTTIRLRFSAFSQLLVLAALIVSMSEVAYAQRCVGRGCPRQLETMPSGMNVPQPGAPGMGMPSGMNVPQPGPPGMGMPSGMNVPAPILGPPMGSPGMSMVPPPNNMSMPGGMGMPSGMNVPQPGPPGGPYAPPPGPGIAVDVTQQVPGPPTCYTQIGSCTVMSPGPCGCVGTDGYTYPGQAQ